LADTSTSSCFSRNAKALGALAASDLGQYIQFDETTTEGKGAKAIFEKYQAEPQREMAGEQRRRVTI
jgi:hypothetical protein